MQLTLTLGVKNLFGCVPGKMKAWWHMEAGKDPSRFGQMLVETAQLSLRRFSMALLVMWSQWWRTALSRHFRASPDVFALDRAMVEISMLHLMRCNNRCCNAVGLCPEIAEIQFPFTTPDPRLEATRHTDAD